MITFIHVFNSQWIDRIRTPRASNEARQRIFSKLSGELKRKIGLKALEAGGNAVIGYVDIHIHVYVHVYVHVPYSGKVSREKTFMNCAV
jgi:hypothetical protein